MKTEFDKRIENKLFKWSKVELIKEVERLQKLIPKKNKNLVIKKMKIEIEKEIHHKGKDYRELEKNCPKGWEIATYPILQELRNSKYIDELNLRDTWEFVQNPDEISKKNNYVARLFVDSGRAYLYCIRYPSISNDGLGGRYFKRLK